MTETFLLDTGPLGMLVHPKQNKKITKWILKELKSNTNIVIPEIADYELRRNLILENFNKSIERLDELKKSMTYLPLTTDIMLRAAELWADARKRGKPTSDPKELDGDVILASQALAINAKIITTNSGHLSLFVSTIEVNELN